MPALRLVSLSLGPHALPLLQPAPTLAISNEELVWQSPFDGQLIWPDDPLELPPGLLDAMMPVTDEASHQVPGPVG